MRTRFLYDDWSLRDVEGGSLFGPPGLGTPCCRSRWKLQEKVRRTAVSWDAYLPAWFVQENEERRARLRDRGAISWWRGVGEWHGGVWVSVKIGWKEFLEEYACPSSGMFKKSLWRKSCRGFLATTEYQLIRCIMFTTTIFCSCFKRML